MALTTATLTGPTSGMCGVVSTNFTVTLDDVAPVGGVSVAIVSAVGGDAFSPNPLVIPAGSNSGTFTLTPNSSVGSRNVSIATTPALTIAGSPISYNATGNCPDDAGGTNQTKDWSGGGTVSCG